jgi:hypothetical protein
VITKTQKTMMSSAWLIIGINSALAIKPEQIHIALAGDNGMRVTWYTAEESADPKCVYGTSPDAMTFQSTGELSIIF